MKSVQYFTDNICQLAVTILTTQCDNALFNCLLHKTYIFEVIYITLGQFLIRRQCQRLNQGVASQEEDLGNAVKKAHSRPRPNNKFVNIDTVKKESYGTRGVQCIGIG